MEVPRNRCPRPLSVEQDPEGAVGPTVQLEHCLEGMPRVPLVDVLLGHDGEVVALDPGEVGSGQIPPSGEIHLDEALQRMALPDVPDAQEAVPPRGVSRVSEQRLVVAVGVQDPPPLQLGGIGAKLTMGHPEEPILDTGCVVVRASGLDVGIFGGGEEETLPTLRLPGIDEGGSQAVPSRITHRRLLPAARRGPRADPGFGAPR